MKSGLKPRSCELCLAEDGLLRCSGCQAVYYCSREHQALDRSAHKRGCNTVKKARATLEAEEQKLRDMPPDVFFPGNVFENSVGHFWGIMETRPYMRARYGLADALLLNFGSAGGRVEAAEAALSHMVDMLRLCRGDNMGIRSIMPALWVALGRDQEAYDFMKWWAAKGEESNFDPGDLSRPFLDIKNADMLEPPMKYWTSDFWVELSHASVVTLIKLRILIDLRNMQNATRAFAGVLPPEITQVIRGHLVGEVLGARPNILKADTDGLARYIETARGQALELYRSIDKYNPHFWDAMKGDPIAEGKTRPPAFSPRSKEEAYLSIGYDDVAWRSSPEAMDLLQTMRMYT